MDIASIFSIAVFLFLIIFIISYFIIKKIKSNKSKKIGNNGEKSVKHILSKICKRKKYKIINNIYLPLYDKTTEIDHIVIGSFGILVCETKAINGEIFVNENEKYWTHIIGNKKHKLYNPLMQNKTHINCIRHILKKEKIYNVNVESLVIFAGNNIEVNSPKGLPIITTDLIKQYFQKSKFKKNHDINIEQIYETLLKYKIDDKSLINKHNSNVSKIAKKG